MVWPKRRSSESPVSLVQFFGLLLAYHELMNILFSNALTFLFMNDGIPIVYYGMEQGFSGGSDPANREALWPSNYANTTAVHHITKLNKLRSWMIESDSRPSQSADKTRDDSYMAQANEKLFRVRSQPGQDPSVGSERVFRSDDEDVIRRDGGTETGFINSPALVAGATQQVMAIVRGSVIGVVTNIGSPVRQISTGDWYSDPPFSCQPQNISFPVLTPYERNVATTEYAFSAPIQSCTVSNCCLVFSLAYNMLSVAMVLSLLSTLRVVIQS